MKHKKVFSAVLAVLMLCVFCGCSSSSGDGSSTIAGSDSAFSEVSTSSSSDISELPTSSDTETSKQEASPTASQTVSDQLVNSAVNPSNNLGIGVYHFQPYWTQSYGTSDAERFKEFEDVLKEGYFNTVIVSPHYAANAGFWEICIENNISVWMSLFNFYNSAETTLDAYIQNVEETVSKIRANSEWWSYFNGFQYDENIWRGQSNADFLAMTEALYKKYSKRNFVVLATGEFTAYEGNQNQINMDAANMKKVNPKALKYITDIGFDSYSVDVRDGAPNGNNYAQWQKVSPNIVDGKTYYSEYTKVLLSLVDHDVNVWFYPCAYTTYLWGGLNGLMRADEGYCLAHLNYFYDLLKEQKYQGGIFLYTYKNNAANELELGLQSKLVVTDDSGEQILTPEQSEKWEYYSKRLKDITDEFKSSKANRISFK